MAFALRMLREHFELLRDPNDPQLLAAVPKPKTLNPETYSLNLEP